MHHFQFPLLIHVCQLKVMVSVRADRNSQFGGQQTHSVGDTVLSLGWPLEAEGSRLMETEFPPLVPGGSVLRLLGQMSLS